MFLLNDAPDNGGSQCVLLFEVLPGAITNDNALDGFSFFPNPAQYVITLDARTAIEDITMYNILRQKVLQQKVDGLSNYQLSVSTVIKRMYLMQVTTNGKVGVYRVVKK